MSANVLKVVVTKDEKAQDFTRKHTTPQLPKWDMDISMVVSHVRGCVLSRYACNVRVNLHTFP